ncbi:hypothetical protein [Hyphomicrobium sp.]|jgi:hypothetical protein|uniref:hypothetical protein n=1 Tax=Hyphomicrobium sp. TaxID=82 RepID=UPI00356ADEC2
MYVTPSRIEFYYPDGRIAVHSDMTREELTSAMLDPALPEDAYYWARMALRSIEMGKGRLDTPD